MSGPPLVPLTQKTLEITPAPRDIVMSGIAGIDAGINTFVLIPKIDITMRYRYLNSVWKSIDTWIGMEIRVRKSMDTQSSFRYLSFLSLNLRSLKIHFYVSLNYLD